MFSFTRIGEMGFHAPNLLLFVRIFQLGIEVKISILYIISLNKGSWGRFILDVNKQKDIMIEDLQLDPQLKWWMLLPISIAMVLVGLLRSNITELMSLGPKVDFFKRARERYVLADDQPRLRCNTNR